MALCIACAGRTGRFNRDGAWVPCARCEGSGDEPRRRMPLIFDRARQERGRKVWR